MSLPPVTRLLDPRSADQARSSPIADAVNIPYEELSLRMHELPSREMQILIAAQGALARRTLLKLEKVGRAVSIFEGCFASGQPIPLRMWEPNAFLEEALPELKPGLALDLGCGSGREAVALAASGWQVVAVDLLPDALLKGQDLARRYTPDAADRIQWIRQDLRKGMPQEGPFDLITSFRYLDRELLAGAQSRLAPGGSLIVEAFTSIHRDRHGKPSSEAHIVESGELPSLFPGLAVRDASDDWRGDSHTARFWGTVA